MVKLIRLLEAPIDDITHIGDWSKGSSFRHRVDRKILTSDKAIQKIKAKWANTEVPFDIFLVNNKEGILQQEVGEVSVPWLQRNMPITLSQIGENNFRSDAVTVIYTNNSGTERVPMTAWIMAHRLGHALFRSDKNPSFQDAMHELESMAKNYLESLYDITITGLNDRWREEGNILNAFFQKIGTMKSARENNLRSDFEFIYELLAQYMITGKITFRPIEGPLGVGRRFWNMQANESELEHFNGSLDEYADMIGSHFENALWHAVGRIYVM
jgi:hypothetical protein